MTPRFLELFSGSQAMADAARDYGWDVLTLDNDPSTHPDLCMDVMDFEPSMLPHGQRPDYVHASPDCTCYSKCSFAINWHTVCGQLSPKRQETWRAVLVAYRAWQIIEALSPTAWTIENPVGMLKNMDFMLPLPRHCVHYCQYGDTAQKPTHIWTNIRTWKSRPRCRNGDPCHVPAPRNSCTPGSTRGKRNAYERSIILCQLCEELVGAAELWLVARGRGDDLCPTPSIVEGLEPYDNERTQLGTSDDVQAGRTAVNSTDNEESGGEREESTSAMETWWRGHGRQTSILDYAEGRGVGS